MSIPWNGVCKGKKLVKCGNNIIDCGGDRYITEWINPTAYASYQIVKESIPLAKRWQQEYAIYGYPLEHHLIYAIWGWVNKNISYKYDDRYPDYWNDVGESYSDRWGDCEDSAIACASAVENFMRDNSKVKLAIGYVIMGGQLYGHAWCYYDSSVFNKRVVLECTYDDYVPPTTYIEGVRYHPTVVVSSREWQVVCNCTWCQEMLNYLHGDALREKTNWKRVEIKPEFKEARPLTWYERLRNKVF
jgi:hypothetical protein